MVETSLGLLADVLSVWGSVVPPAEAARALAVAQGHLDGPKAGLRKKAVHVLGECDWLLRYRGWKEMRAVCMAKWSTLGMLLAHVSALINRHQASLVLVCQHVPVPASVPCFPRV